MKLVYIMFIFSAMASQYAQGKMEQTVRVRQSGATSYDLPHVLPPVDGYVAHYNCDAIGSIMWIRPRGSTEWESFLVVDCGGLNDGGLAYLLYGSPFPMSRAQAARALNAVERGTLIPKVAIELDYATAKRWNCVGRGCPVEILTLREQQVYKEPGSCAIAQR